jgi:MoaA/NifB/PqqE/SkfB family radical SAM enzyme
MFKEYLKNAKRLNDKVDDIMSVAVFDKLVNDLTTSVSNTKSITFTGGGEPLLNPDFNLMVKKAMESHLDVGLITNGIRVEEVEDPDLFKFIRISLDAASRETYKAIKGVDAFPRVIDNIERLKSKDAFVGISFVICEENRMETNEAKKIAAELGVDYIQFKPAWVNGYLSQMPSGLDGEKSIVMERYIAEDSMPCKIAGLVGIVSADGSVYYCCQHRGNKNFRLGSIKENPFNEIWYSRFGLNVDFSKCPRCRYVGYSAEYKKLVAERKMDLDHINFL